MNLAIYLLFLSLSLVTTKIAGEIYVIEISALIVLVMIVKVYGVAAYSSVASTDLLIYLYLAYSLLPIMFSVGDVVESIKFYRTNVLTPTLIYLAFRYIPVNTSRVRAGLFLIIPVALIQSILLTRDYILHGERPQFFEGSITYTITLASLFTIAIAVILFNIRAIKGYIKKYTLALVAIVILVGLYNSFSRTSLISLVIFIPLAIYICKRPRLSKYIVNIVLISTICFIFIVFTDPFSYQDSGLSLEQQRKLQHSSKRLTNSKIILQDLTARFKMWSDLADRAMEYPITGGGGAVYKINTATSSIASPHNIYVSVLLVSGVPGLIIFYFTFSTTLRNFIPLTRNQKFDIGIVKTLAVCFLSLYLVALTGGLSGGRIFIFYAFMGLIVNYARDQYKLLNA